MRTWTGDCFYRDVLIASSTQKREYYYLNTISLLINGQGNFHMYLLA